MKWEEFDKTILLPFEANGDRAREFGENVNVFSYTQIRLIAIQAFNAFNNASEPASTPDEANAGGCKMCASFHDLGIECNYCGKQPPRW